MAVVKGTKAHVVSSILKQIPDSEREKVTEITMDFSDSMFSIAKQCFPKATIVRHRLFSYCSTPMRRT